MKEKGFTLIELLAVIVILAVIALIATPLVMLTINDAKDGSLKATTRTIISEAEKTYVQKLQNNPNVTPTVSASEIKYSGEQIPEENIKVSFNRLGVASIAIYKDSKCVYKNYNDKDVTLDKTLTLDECLSKVKKELPTLMKADPNWDNSYFLDGPIKRYQIEDLTFINKQEAPNNIIGSYDVSEMKDGSVLAYYSDTDNNGYYEVVIGGDGGVAANEDSSYLFRDFGQATVIDVTYLDTSNVTNMKGMFLSVGYYVENSAIVGLDQFDTSNVVDMSYMFENIGYLATTFDIGDISNWDTSSVTNMERMFEHCDGITSLNLSGWDTSNVMNMVCMFLYCHSLTSLDLSHWATQNGLDMSSMFWGCDHLTSLDIRNMDFDGVEEYECMFSEVPSSIQVITKDVNAETFVNERLSEPWCVMPS